MENRVANASVPTLVWTLRIVNILNACLLCVAGVLVFVFDTLDVLLVLSSLYIIAFSLLLLCFEILQIRMFQLMIFRNFGFMFSPAGRILFFLFIGTLAFGIGTLGIVAGCVTAANVIFNTYVLCKNPYYKEHMAAEAYAMRSRALDGAVKSGVPMQAVVTHTPAVAASSSSSGASLAPAAIPPVSPAGLGPDWKKFHDEASGTDYWYNETSKETRWA